VHWRWQVLLACAACGRIGFSTPDDAAVDAPFPTGPFGPAAPIDVLNSSVEDDDVSLTADMLEIYFGSQRSGAGAVWRSTRASIDEPWPPPVEVVELGDVNNPRVSLDGLTFYCANQGGVGITDIWFATRPDRDAPWSALALVPGINTVDDEFEPWVHGDRLVIYVTYLPATGTTGIARADRASLAEPFGAARVIDALVGPGYDGGVWVDETERRLVFHSDRGGNRDLFESTRPSATDLWGPPVAMSDLNTAAFEADLWMSPDGHTVYFASRRDGNDDIFMATR
jgi:hypothetical protein